MNDIVKYSWEDSKEMPLTTAEYSGKIWKGVQKIPTAKAVVFRLNNGIWSRFK